MIMDTELKAENCQPQKSKIIRWTLRNKSNSKPRTVSKSSPKEMKYREKQETYLRKPRLITNYSQDGPNAPRLNLLNLSCSKRTQSSIRAIMDDELNAEKRDRQQRNARRSRAA